MKIIELKKIEHATKVGQVCNTIEPNVNEDSLFVINGEIIGFYIRSIANYSLRCSELAKVANAELLSKRVPKDEMRRSSGVIKGKAFEVKQFSTIIGSIPPKPHMMRPYATRSSVHNSPTAKTFIKAMLLLCKESENLIQQIAPNIYDRQLKIIEENIPEKWRFGKLFTSSISNFNIAAPFHIDTGNLVGCVNVIIAKRQNSTGGNTTVPDYGATMDSCDDSMLVYPAWQNVHGVTPIIPTKTGGYRNSLVFYPLKAFKGIE